MVINRLIYTNYNRKGDDGVVYEIGGYPITDEAHAKIVGVLTILDIPYTDGEDSYKAFTLLGVE